MSNIAFPPVAFPLASIEAVRPVFLIVMGVFLTLIAWRLAKTSGIWTARLMISGALMLGFGYAVMLPLYEAGVLKYYSPQARYHGDAASILAWHAVKLVVMNAGWLLFGIGIAMHARIFNFPQPRPRAVTQTIPPHESVA
jgi:hypothetical protein